ncbi:MAG: isoprenylcysteine carboxylmethyltransferase family protein [Ardenticatenales bacterium]|nr:isoprenylcysteine carboxylmethyltransferase family protein [Ardenticatenales bacterium]
MSTVYLPSPLGGMAFALCFLGWVLLEGWVNLRGWQAGSTHRDRFSRYLIIVGMVLAISLATWATGLHMFDVPSNRDMIFYGGVFLMGTGLLFRAYAIQHLGRYFVPEVLIQPNQSLVMTGPYRYIRHPSYTGTFLTVIGFGLALTNWLSLALMVALSVPMYAFRITVEEQAMIEAFGEEYRRYMQHSKRLIPFLLLFP